MGDLMQRIRHVFHLLVRVQTERPWVIGLLALVTTVPALLAARGLGLKTDFSELLPDNKPSVVEMRRVAQKLTVRLDADDGGRGPGEPPRGARGIRRTRSCRKIQALGPEWVGAVDAGNRESHAFFDHNKLLYAPLDEIRKVHDEVRERYDYEVQKRAGGDLGLDDPPPPLTAADAARAVRQSRREARAESRGSGYYIGEDGKLLAILIRTPVEPGSIEPAHRLRAKIDAVVAEVDPDVASIRA